VSNKDNQTRYTSVNINNTREDKKVYISDQIKGVSARKQNAGQGFNSKANDDEKLWAKFFPSLKSTKTKTIILKKYMRKSHENIKKGKLKKHVCNFSWANKTNIQQNTKKASR